MKSRWIRKAILCEILTYSERTESQLSPKVLLTTICDLYLLHRIPVTEYISSRHDFYADADFGRTDVSIPPCASCTWLTSILWARSGRQRMWMYTFWRVFYNILCVCNCVCMTCEIMSDVSSHNFVHCQYRDSKLLPGYLAYYNVLDTFAKFLLGVCLVTL